jgi:phosphopantetheine adenylyltransferase
VTALGGTFDHLHAAHKLLLHLALFLTTKKLIVGVMAQHLLSSKSNFELLQPLSDRIGGVKEFLRRAAGKGRKGVELDVVEIQDPYGPTAWDADIGCLVVSRETVSGGRAVNQKRREGGLGELEVWVIDVIAASAPATAAEGEGEGESTTATIEAGEQGTRTGAIPLHEHLKGEQDESKLKDLKMGSTAIRQWIKDHPTS